jgi:hypothetical protein
MNGLHRDGKRSSSVDRAAIEAKRNRSSYLAENPSAVVAENTNIHHRPKKRFNGTNLKILPRRSLPARLDPQLPALKSFKDLTIREKLQVGIAAGFRREQTSAQARPPHLSSASQLSPSLEELKRLLMPQLVDTGDMAYPGLKKHAKSGRAETKQEHEKIRWHLGKRHPHV